MRVLLPDSWHFHDRNFPALFRYLRQFNIAVTVHRQRADWLRLLGDYTGKAADLAPYLRQLEALDAAALLALRHRGVPVFACARGEFLALVLPRPAWQEEPVPGRDDAALMARALREQRQELLLNMAAAMSWIDHWAAYLAGHRRFSHVCVFSGCYIYTRTLMALLQLYGIRCLVMESFFTGNDSYCEERYGPVPNNSDLRHATYYNSLRLPADPTRLDRLRAAAHGALRRGRNKNVRAPTDEHAAPFPNDRPSVLVIGQVLNDFSIVETPLSDLATTRIYRGLISAILAETPFNVVFKAHPWERARSNARAPLTYDKLAAFREGLPADQQARFQIVERPRIQNLFQQVDWVATLSSQGALEACAAGLKPAQLGQAFYGGKGFTHDLSEPAELVALLRDTPAGGQLTLEEYRAFEMFLVRAFFFHLINDGRLGHARLAAIFEGEPNAPLEIDVDRVIEMAEEDVLRNGGLWNDIDAFLANPYPILRDALSAALRPLRRRS